MPRIEEMYAFVAEDTGPDDEGVIGIQTAPGDFVTDSPLLEEVWRGTLSEKLV